MKTRQQYPKIEGLDRKIWRYMSLESLISLLGSESLYFSSVKQLIDAWEGELPSGNYFEIGRDARNRYEEELSGIDGDQDMAFARAIHFHPQAQANRAISSEIDAHYRVCCWHLNEHESWGMWESYIRRQQGVAIKSTIGRLDEALEHSHVQGEFLIAEVIYGTTEYSSDAIEALLSKREHYEYEQELRALVRFEEPCDSGKGVSVDIGRLIEGVILSPFSKEWHVGLVNDLLGKYDQTGIPVSMSEIRIRR